MAFLNKGLSTHSSTNLRFVFPVPEAAHLRPGTGCREQGLEQLELLCHPLGTASDIAAGTGIEPALPVWQLTSLSKSLFHFFYLLLMLSTNLVQEKWFGDENSLTIVNQLQKTGTNCPCSPAEPPLKGEACSVSREGLGSHSPCKEPLLQQRDSTSAMSCLLFHSKSCDFLPFGFTVCEAVAQREHSLRAAALCSPGQ